MVGGSCVIIGDGRARARGPSCGQMRRRRRKETGRRRRSQVRRFFRSEGFFIFFSQTLSAASAV
jgi:hypothetical protein